MIVPMKKVVLVTQVKDARDAVEGLRKAGLLHVEHIQAPGGKDISRISDGVLLADQAIGVLAIAFPQAKQDTFSGEKIDWEKIATHIIDIEKRRQQLREYGVTLRNDIRKWKAWGDFDPRDIASLRQQNVYLGFYQIPTGELRALKARFPVKEIFRNDDTMNCLVITQGQPGIPYKELELPRASLAAMQRRLEEDAKALDSLSAELAKYVVYYRELIHAKAGLEKELEFYQALSGMGEDGSLSYIKGFIPVNAQKDLAAIAKRQKWALRISDPSGEDNVPTLLRNPRWIEIIKPVLRILGILPGYRELDISLLFLIFFSVFFGILIGDAGYGLCYLLLAVWFHKKKGINAQNVNMFLLFYVLSFCAIVWGILTGSFFGQEWLVRYNIKPLVPALNDSIVMQEFCFFLGSLHLTIAHAWRALVKFPAPDFLADLGWIAILWVSYFMARALILSQPFPCFGMALAACGIILVLFFSNPCKNPLRALGRGLASATFGLSFMSAFTDVVSYVRLFAVGVAAVAIANTTNTMAASIGSGAIALAGGVLITVVGHALNVVLGPIAVLVHGVRLNVLEFGLNHTNITWSGTTYKPLA